MAFSKRVLLALSVLAVGVYAAPQRNEYLPPDQGYNYPKPSVPFVSQTPVARPAIEYRPPSPPVTSPIPRPTPSYIPPSQPAYKPPPPPVYNQPPAPPPQTQYTPAPPKYNQPQPQPQRPNTPYPPANNQPDHSHDGSHDHGHSADHVHEPGMPYDFNYAVKDDYYGTDFAQNEVSDGDNVKGEYRVQLPDGRLQIVRYTADWKTGFHAEVTYEGEAKYPEQAPYKPPQQPQRPQNNPNGSSTNQAGNQVGYNYPAPQNKPSSNYGAPSTGY